MTRITVHDEDVGLLVFTSVRAFDEYVLGEPELLYDRHYDERAVMADLATHCQALVDTLAEHENMPGAAQILDLVGNADTNEEIDQVLRDAQLGRLGDDAQGAITAAIGQVAHDNAVRQVRRYWPDWYPTARPGSTWRAACPS